MFQFDKLIQDWQNNYYTELLLMIVELFALIIGLVHVRKYKIGQFFIFYISFDFSLFIVDNYIFNHQNITIKNANYFLSITNPLISLIELSAYYYFFLKVLTGHRIKLLLKVLFTIFISLTIIFFITKFSFLNPRLNYMSFLVSVAEFTFLLPPCFYFFYQLMNNISTINLLERPSFWIVTGIFFYALISIPYLLLQSFLLSNDVKIRYALSASLYYTPFALNFVFLIKAFLCKKTLTI